MRNELPGDCPSIIMTPWSLDCRRWLRDPLGGDTKLNWSKQIKSDLAKAEEEWLDWFIEEWWEGNEWSSFSKRWNLDWWTEDWWVEGHHDWSSVAKEVGNLLCLGVGFATREWMVVGPKWSLVWHSQDHRRPVFNSSRQWRIIAVWLEWSGIGLKDESLRNTGMQTEWSTSWGEEVSLEKQWTLWRHGGTDYCFWWDGVEIREMIFVGVSMELVACEVKLAQCPKQWNRKGVTVSWLTVMCSVLRFSKSGWNGVNSCLWLLSLKDG